MRIKDWFKDYFNGLFRPFDDIPLIAFMTERELEELFAATKEEDWEDE